MKWWSQLSPTRQSCIIGVFYVLAIWLVWLS